MKVKEITRQMLIKAKSKNEAEWGCCLVVDILPGGELLVQETRNKTRKVRHFINCSKIREAAPWEELKGG